MTLEQIKHDVRNIPDFPTKGIQFKDTTTVFGNAEELRFLKDTIVQLYRNCGITKVVGVESRGFILAPAIAMDLGAGFVPIRKPGKLPAEIFEESYTKEYGIDRVQIHTDALTSEDVVLIHDDLLATGGSMSAAINLVKKFGVKKIYVNFVIELDGLHGRDMLEGVEVESLIHY